MFLQFIIALFVLRSGVGCKKSNDCLETRIFRLLDVQMIYSTSYLSSLEMFWVSQIRYLGFLLFDAVEELLTSSEGHYLLNSYQCASIRLVFGFGLTCNYFLRRPCANMLLFRHTSMVHRQIRRILLVVYARVRRRSRGSGSLSIHWTGRICNAD